ncbi:MAG: flagellar hook-associated protein FlgL [Oscillospiraceae bacterium]|nr:flagellar hook-associated protein FlgL [Oscillospiraceae bacterium]
MRITNGMMMRKYGKNLNVNLGRMNRTSQQIESGRRFQRASEDPVRGLKALQIRRNLSSLHQYSSNIDTVDSWLAQTEVAVSAIKSHADKAVDLVLQGRNDTLSSEDRLLIATSLRNVQEALLKDLNSQVAGKYLLGGANTKEVPFTVDPDTGQLMFSGVSVWEYGQDGDPGSGVGFTPFNPHDEDAVGHFNSLEAKAYVDLTGEFQLDDGEVVDKSTLFDMYTPGLAVVGVGPNNLYNLIGRIIHAFESEHRMEPETVENVFNTSTGEYEDMVYMINKGTNLMRNIDGPVEELEYLLDIIDDPNSSPEAVDKAQKEYDLYSEAYTGGDGLFKRLQDAQLNALISLVNVGEKANFVSYLQERNEEYVYQAEVMQNKLEGIPADEAIMNFKMQDYIYKACLQMGSYIFQPSLMDYIKR